MTDPSIDPSDFMPAERPWWHSAVVYQVYPRSFADSDGDGVGDLRGIIDHLDHLVTLGVDVVWFSPFFTSPQDDNGYDVASYTDIDPLFGTLDDADALIAACHERGLKVVFDLVLNHTSDEHPWFVESRDPASPKRDWYYWRAEPTNWGAVFGGSAWELDDASGEYYLHLFSRRQPDLNWHNPELRAEIFRILNWWVDRGVDGFRLDVINFIGKKLPIADGVVAPGSEFSYDILGLGDEEVVHRYLHEMHEAVGGDRVLFSVGEMPGVSVESARRYTDPANGELGMVFTFEHMEVDQRPGGAKWEVVPMELPRLKAVLARWQDGLADVGWNSLYLGNHDQPRVVSRWGDPSPEHRVQSAKAWATVLHLMKGTPYVYQGEEIGMTNAGFTSIEQYRDIESLNFHRDALGWGLPEEAILAALAVKSRDNARTPMQWTAGENAGFTTGEPWLAVNPNHTEINVEAALADPASVFHHYRHLIEMRHALSILVEGDFELLLPSHPQLFAYARHLHGEVLVVTANLSSEPVELPYSDTGADEELPSLQGARLVLCTHGDACDASTMRPWEARVHLWTPNPV